MADLARAAGVSTSTASRALADSPLISDSTKNKVRSIAEKHHYRPHLGARNLRTKRSNAIALIFPFDFGPRLTDTSPKIISSLDIGSSYF